MKTISQKDAKNIITKVYDLLDEGSLKQVFGWRNDGSRDTNYDRTGFSVSGGFSRSRVKFLTWCKTPAGSNVYECKNRVELTKDGSIEEFGNATFEEMLNVIREAL